MAENALKEGGHEEYAGIALGIIFNVVKYAINAIEKYSLILKLFSLNLIYLSIEILYIIIPIAALIALIQGMKNRRTGAIIYFFGFFLVGLVFLYAQLMNPSLVIDLISPLEFAIDTIVLIVILFAKYIYPKF